MTLQEVAQKFVALCRQGKNFEVMETMYSPDMVSVEASGHETVGQGPVIEKSRRWAGANEIHGSQVRGPFFNGATQFAVMFTMDVTPKDTGKRVSNEEVAVYTVKDGWITREQFFYEGKW